MSYKIVRQTLNGQRRIIVRNGILSYDDACEIASQLDYDMQDDGSCEGRGFILQEEHVIEEE